MLWFTNNIHTGSLKLVWRQEKTPNLNVYNLPNEKTATKAERWHISGAYSSFSSSMPRQSLCPSISLYSPLTASADSTPPDVPSCFTWQVAVACLVTFFPCLKMFVVYLVPSYADFDDGYTLSKFFLQLLCILLGCGENYLTRQNYICRTLSLQTCRFGEE